MSALRSRPNPFIGTPSANDDGRPIDFVLTKSERQVAADAAVELQRQRVERNRRDALRRRFRT